MIGLFFILSVLAVRRPEDTPTTETARATTTPTTTNTTTTPVAVKKGIDFSVTQQAILITTGALAGFVIISGAVITIICRRQNPIPGARRIDDPGDIAQPEAEGYRDDSTNL
jgi:hypothetical protein